MQKKFEPGLLQTAAKIPKDPGVLFSAANIFAFSQSGNAFALGIAVATFALAAAQCCLRGKGDRHPLLAKLGRQFDRLPEGIKGDSDSSALRITAYGALLGGILSLSSGAVLPGIAGLSFAIGNIFASSRAYQEIQRNPKIMGAKKALSNPPVYYGIGYAMIGLMAGGGMNLLARPIQPAMVTTLLGIGATTLSSTGLLLGKFQNPAAPFMTVAFGTCINTLSGVLSGNPFGAVNNFLAMCGETRLGHLNFLADKKRLVTMPSDAVQADGNGKKSAADRFFGAASDALVALLRVLDQKYVSLRNCLALKF